MGNESTNEPTTTKQIALTLKDQARIFLHDDSLFVTTKYNVTEIGVWATGKWLLNYEEVYKSRPENGISNAGSPPRYSREYLLLIPHDSIRFIDIDFEYVKEAPSNSSSVG